MEREKLVALVSAGQQGDPEALNALFEAFYNDVYYFALKTVKDQDAACDITQETFVKIIGHIGDLKEPAAFVGWMKQIAYHECLRFTKKTPEILVDEDEEGNSIFDIAAEDRSEFIPDEAMDQKDFRRTILAMLDQLSPEQRSATMLYYYDEMSVRQIAQIQGVSEGTVKSRLNYARKAIKASVESYEKKHDIRLHSVGLLPILSWVLSTSSQTMPAGAALVAAGGITAATGVAVSGGAAAAGTAAAGTAVATGAAAAGTVAVPLAVKVAAVVAAAAVTLGGVGVALRPDTPRETTAPTETVAVQQPQTQPSATDPFADTTAATTTETTQATTEAATEAPTEATTERTEATTEATEEATEATETTTAPTEATTVPTEEAELVPAGCKYILADGTELGEGEAMPEEPAVGDSLVTADYTYRYMYSLSLDTWQEANAAGWGVGVNDKTKTNYGSLLSYINGYPVRRLNYTFYGCSNMTTAPAIPGTVTSLFMTFSNCVSLSTPPEVPGSVSSMSNTFYGCVSLSRAPVIPAGVSFMDMTFGGCTALSGEVTIHANPASYVSCFGGTVNAITLTGSSTVLAELAATANNGNVTVK